MKKLLFLLVLCSSSILGFAQENVLKGTIKDDGGNPIPGAAVQIEGTQRGTITDFNGSYSLNDVKAGDVITFSYIGTVPQKITYDGSKQINISLQQDVQLIDGDVVVVGYGSAKAKDLTAPILTLKEDEIETSTGTSALQSFQGKLPGVQITNTGSPGSSPQIRIRGVGSIQDNPEKLSPVGGTPDDGITAIQNPSRLDNNSPLYVVDGIFFDDIDFLNPSDIENISILKDASSAAIYGVRASAGVVLVTTKSGRKNMKPTFTYNGYQGVQVTTQKLDMANSQQYSDVLRASGDPDFAQLIQNSIDLYGGVTDANGTAYPATNTDWYDELTRVAPISSHSLSLSGGTENATYSMGVNYFKQDGIQSKSNSDFERINLRAKTDIDVTKHLKTGFNFIYSRSNANESPGGWLSAYVAPPILPVFDHNQPEGNSYPTQYAAPSDINLSSFYTNPVAYVDYHKNRRIKEWQFAPQIYAELRPFENIDLAFKSVYNGDFRFSEKRVFVPAFKIGTQETSESRFLKTNYYTDNYTIDNTLNYRKTIGDHSFTVLLGQSFQEERYRFLAGTVNGVPEGDISSQYITNGIEDTENINDGGTTQRRLSAFSRVSYNYKDRYLFTGTFRADGTTKYQEKWGYFPSFGGGWVISNEDFWGDNNPVNYLKFRASWGQLGNDKVPANDGIQTVETGGLGQSGVFGGTSLIPGQVNQTLFSELKWERISETNVGFESLLFDERLRVEMDYYSRETRDLVIRTILPNGQGSLLQNAGEVRNRGLEFATSWADNIGKDFTYSIGGNFTVLDNEVTDLGDSPNILGGNGDFRQISFVGETLNSYYGHELDGVYQTQAEVDNDPIAVTNNLAPGDFRKVDQNGDGIINDDDRVLIGNPEPDFNYAFYFSIGYKGWDLNTTFQGVAGVDLINLRRGDIAKHPRNNMDEELATSLWNGEGSTNAYPSAAGLFKPWNTGSFNEFFVENGDYIRLQNVQLSYTFNDDFVKTIGLTGVRLYVNADRPYTWFTSNGFTPEVPGGRDSGVYPVAAVYSLGAKITF